MATLYLVNNKEEETSFLDSFNAEAEQAGFAFVPLDVRELAFFCNRTKAVPQIFYKGDPLTFRTEDMVFIRRWAPHIKCTALFSIILQAQGIPISDARMNTCHDIRSSKLSQCFQLQPRGIRFPHTFVVPLHGVGAVIEQIGASLSYPLVVKTEGSRGQQVWNCASREVLDEKLHTLGEGDGNPLILFQEYIQNTFDIRVIVWKGKVLAAISRSSQDGFYNNVSQGGRAEKIDLTTQEEDMAIEAAQAIGLDLCGVDIVRSAYGPLLFETNKAPDIVMFNEAAGFDISAHIARAFVGS